MPPAVSETVINAACHGRLPAQLRVWTGRDRIVVAVTDQGSGLADPYAGLLPGANSCPAMLGRSTCVMAGCGGLW